MNHLDTLQSLCRGTDEIYERYIQPNEACFRQNHTINSASWDASGYEECVLDFVPITDGEYLVIDQEDKCGRGIFAAASRDERDRGKESFASLLIADQWDPREFMPVIWEKSWAQVYIVLNQEKKRFSSFCKLEEFSRMLPPNTTIFSETEEMHRYFLDNPDIYLPKKVCAPEPDGYEKLLNRIHEIRIQSGIPSDDVFLSICIPSYDRGARALEAVRHALTAQYDSEIEVVLCNNGSTRGVESYREIKNMRDSRLRYYEYEINEGPRVVFGNCLKRARGRFALVLSDEDSLAVENLDQVLDYLKASPNIGACCFDATAAAYGINRQRPEWFKAGEAAALEWSVQRTAYYSGDCLNMDLLRAADIFSQIEQFRDNYMLQYQLCIFCFLLASKFDVATSEIQAWNYGEPESTGGGSNSVNNNGCKRDDGLMVCYLPEDRTKETHGIMELTSTVLCGDELKKMFLYSVRRFLSSTGDYYAQEGELLSKMYRWIDICTVYYKDCLQLLEHEKEKFENLPQVIREMDEVFFYWLDCKKIRKWHTAEENLMASLRAQAARYYYDKGTAFDEIDFQRIDRALEGLVRDSLMERS